MLKGIKSRIGTQAKTVTSSKLNVGNEKPVEQHTSIRKNNKPHTDAWDESEVGKVINIYDKTKKAMEDNLFRELCTDKYVENVHKEEIERCYQQTVDRMPTRKIDKNKLGSNQDTGVKGKEVNNHRSAREELSKELTGKKSHNWTRENRVHPRNGKKATTTKPKLNSEMGRVVLPKDSIDVMVSKYNNGRSVPKEYNFVDINHKAIENETHFTISPASKS